MWTEYQGKHAIIRKLHHTSIFLSVYSNIDCVDLDFIDTVHVENVIKTLDRLCTFFIDEYKNINLDVLVSDAHKAASVDYKDKALQLVMQDTLDLLNTLMRRMKEETT